MLNNFSCVLIGNVKIQDCNCNFVLFKNNLLKIHPAPKDYDTVYKALFSEDTDNLNVIHWIYGTNIDNQYIAFKLPDYLSDMDTFCKTITISVSYFLTSNTPFNMSCENPYQFDKIIFSGKAVDLIYPLDQFVNIVSFGNNNICLCLPSDQIKENVSLKNNGQNIYIYTDTKYYEFFKSNIKKNDCTLLFSISPCLNLIEKSTLTKSYSSILEISFDKLQDTSMGETCYQAVCNFLAFCIGKLNIFDLQITLCNSTSCNNANLYINSNTEGIQLSVSTTKPFFQISDLGKKAGDLFKTIANEDTCPILSFMPKNDGDLVLDTMKLRELCSALELEFNYSKQTFEHIHLIDSLIKNLKSTVDCYKKDNFNAFSKKTYDHIYSTIDHISFAAADKFKMIYSRYKEYINKLFSELYWGEDFDFSDDTTNENIDSIVKLRNSVTHSKLTNNECINNAIYDRLKWAFLCSVLARSGYSNEDIKAAINNFLK